MVVIRLQFLCAYFVFICLTSSVNKQTGKKTLTTKTNEQTKKANKKPPQNPKDTLTNKTQGEGNPGYICGNTMEVGLSVCFLPSNFQVKSPEQGYFEFFTLLCVRFANHRVHLFLNLLWFSSPN